jgi:hypothetical protein
MAGKLEEGLCCFFGHCSGCCDVVNRSVLRVMDLRSEDRGLELFLPGGGTSARNGLGDPILIRLSHEQLGLNDCIQKTFSKRRAMI